MEEIENSICLGVFIFFSFLGRFGLGNYLFFVYSKVLEVMVICKVCVSRFRESSIFWEALRGFSLFVSLLIFFISGIMWLNRISFRRSYRFFSVRWICSIMRICRTLRCSFEYRRWEFLFVFFEFWFILEVTWSLDNGGFFFFS